MTRRLSGALALALLVAACAPEPSQPSGPTAVASEARSHVTGSVPYMEQNLYDIVDETGTSIWQPYSDTPPTQASFTLSIFQDPCVIVEEAYVEPDVPETDRLLFDIIGCGVLPLPTYRSEPNLSLARSDLENCSSQRAPYPFAMTASRVTCWRFFAFTGSGYPNTTEVTLDAAPTAPGDRVFKRWEVRNGPGELRPCTEGETSRQCTFVLRWPEDYSEGVLPDIFIKLHYGPPSYDFSGFFRPVDNLPTVNTVRAGRAVPIKFRLGGDRGLDVLAAGSPSSRKVDCSSSAPLDAIEETVTAGQSSLTYDAASGEYTYVWKTEAAWARTCRELTLTLNDGSTPKTARFQF